MMINLLSIKCSLAFAPYLTASAAEFISDRAIASRVVRQGGRGLIVRSDGDLTVRHENRQAALGREEAQHYLATLQFRSEIYDVALMQDEIVLANSRDELLLSHPQSEIWLKYESVAALLRACVRGSIEEETRDMSDVPDWLTVSIGGGRLLLSDQRTGRWVLLGDDHIRELERRLGSRRSWAETAVYPAPPTIPVKGLTTHLQSALTLVETLEGFAHAGRIAHFEEITPTYSLKARPSTEGIELSDSDSRVTMTAREARKWAQIVRAEIERLKVRRVDRGGIRTVFAEDERGRWILQWGDEIFLPNGERSEIAAGSNAIPEEARGGLCSKRVAAFLLLLSPATGACVALTDSESKHVSEDLDWS